MKTEIYLLACNVRKEFEEKYGLNLAGHCIEASEIIAARISSQLGLDAVTKEGWCRFDEESYGSDHPWDPHTWVEIPSMNLYVDVTADQFNYGMYEENQFPAILLHSGLPAGMQYEEPTWDDYEMESEELGVENNNLFEAEDALRALNHALDSLNHAESRADKLHPSIGNHITTAKLIVNEAIASIQEEREKAQSLEASLESELRKIPLASRIQTAEAIAGKAAVSPEIKSVQPDR